MKNGFGKIFACHITQAIIYLHDNNLVHGAISSRTCMIDGKMAKLSIIGYVTQANTKKEQYWTSETLPWVSPEQLTKCQPLTEKVDIYSLGVILWQLYTNGIPWAQFSGRPEPQIEQGNFLKCNPIPENISRDSGIIDLIGDCLNLEPTKRPTAVQCLERLIEITET